MKKLLTLAIVALLSFASYAQGDDATPYSVDFGQKVGKIKPLNGVNLWTNFYFENSVDRQDLAEACKISTVRLHDVPLDNQGMRLVDVHQIFSNLKADPKNPDNYFFAATDDYIKKILKGGATPIYRLGTSIEHTERKYFAKRPENPEQYAEICAGIVRHYNEGWNDGFHWNLPYWEIWNEPEGTPPTMWDDPNWDSYCSFYVIVAKRLRAEFPNIKIGGPALCWANLDYIKRLVKFCKEADAPLDFVSWHSYAPGYRALIDTPYAVRECLDELGYEDTELHLNEWHYLPRNDGNFYGNDRDYEAQRQFSTAPESMNGYISAAVNDFVMTRWQDGPLDMGNYYAYELEKCNVWGCFDITGEPRPTYYSLRVFGELATEAPERVKTTDPGETISLLGGIDASGEAKRLLVSIFNDGEGAEITIALKGVPAEGTVKISKIDKEASFAEIEQDYSNGKLTIKTESSAVYLIRF